jgi:four helix bundle protein
MNMDTKIKEFTDLKVWQEGHRLVMLIYRETKTFPKEETYSLVDQIRRAVTSITANVAEGFGRQGYKEKIQFYYLAQGSLTELKNFLFVARDVGYMSNNRFEDIMNQLTITHQLLQGLLRKSKSFLNLKS